MIRYNFFRYQDDTPGATGSGGGGMTASSPASAPATSAPASSPVAAPAATTAPAAPAEKKFDIKAASDQIGKELFGKTQARAQDGKFAPNGSPSPAPKPGEPAATSAPAATTAPVATPAPPAATPAPSSSLAPAPGFSKPVDLNKPPESWKAEAAKDWAALPENVRSEIHRREQNIFQGIEQYKGDATIGRTMKQVMAPVLNHLREANVQPEHFVGGLLHAHMTLSNSNAPEEQRVAFAVNLLRNYGIDLSKYQIGENDPSTRQALAEDHPTVRALRSELQALQSKITERDRSEAASVYGKLTEEVNKFASDPANEYFAEVADDLVTLIMGSGGKLSLKDAYDRAVYANPATRAKMTAKLEQAAQEKAKREAEEAAKRVALATGANVESGGHSGVQHNAPTGSWDDTMQATLAKIRSR